MSTAKAPSGRICEKIIIISAYVVSLSKANSQMICQTGPQILRTHFIFMKEVDSDWTDIKGHVIASI